MEGLLESPGTRMLCPMGLSVLNRAHIPLSDCWQFGTRSLDCWLIAWDNRYSSPRIGSNPQGLDRMHNYRLAADWPWRYQR